MVFFFYSKEEVVLVVVRIGEPEAKKIPRTFWPWASFMFFSRALILWFPRAILYLDDHWLIFECTAYSSQYYLQGSSVEQRGTNKAGTGGAEESILDPPHSRLGPY